jgi:pimeloyl-ACP methyl ester carboxylesterase
MFVPMAVLAAAAAPAATAYVVAATAVAQHVVTPARRKKQDVRILSVADDLSTVTLAGGGDALTVPGRYGLWFSQDRGYALISDILEIGEDGVVTRRLDAVVWGDIRGAKHGRLSGWYFTSPDDIGLTVHSVDIPTDGGAAPAWLFPADGSGERWAIHVHGRGARRQETLRAIPVFHEKGYTSLAVSYRNDADAPDSPDHRYGLGGTEWRDVDAAIAYALRNGARHIVLFGWSMGGAAVLQTAVRSFRGDSVRGIVLDSPVIDWIETLRFQAREMGLPRLVTQGALVLLDSGWARALVRQDAPIGLRSLDFTVRARELSVPVLLMHSDDDGYVPAGGSKRLAQLRPDIVTFERFDEGKHTKLWNIAPERWTRAIENWLDLLEQSLKADV